MMRHPLAGLLFLSVAVFGCGESSTPVSDPTGPNLPLISQTLSGKAMDGQQPIAGAHVYLLAANTTGYGNGSASLLVADSTGYSDSVGAYVLTKTDGSFSIPGTYSCPAGDSQVYVYVLGGNADLGTNPAIGELAVLGDCPSLAATAVPSMIVNEVTTVAAAYAMAGYATDATHVSSSGTSLAKTGVANAFANAANLANLTTGAALATTPAGNGTVPQNLIISLANALAACVSSKGAVTGPTDPTACYTLFTNAESNGSTGTEPSDTATAAINIAHNPGSDVSTLYNLQTGMPVFGKGLATQPNDFTMLLQFTGGGLNRPNYIVVDGSGYVWVTNSTSNSISKFSNTGVAVSPVSGYTGGGLDGPEGIAIDGSGNVWVANPEGNSLSEFTDDGIAFSNSPYIGGGLDYCFFVAIDVPGNAWVVNASMSDSLSKFTSVGVAFPNSPYTGGGLLYPNSAAIDGAGNVWTGNGGFPVGSLSKFSNIGIAISPSTGYNGGGLDAPIGIAIDSSGNVWAANSNTDGISKFSNAGTALSPSTGYTGGGTALPEDIAIDGAGNVWFVNTPYVNPSRGSNDVSEFSNAGVAISPPTGYTGGGVGVPIAIAVDGSGNVWIANHVGGGLNELVGAATPVITPVGAGLPATPTADGSSKKGTRP